MSWKSVMAAGIGGAMGILLRYGLSVITYSPTFPYGTLIANIIGSLLLGGLTGYVLEKEMKDWIKTGIGVGFCGGFTTMSTFAADTLYVFQLSIPLSIVYFSVSFIGGVVFALIGVVLGHSIGRKNRQGQAREGG